MEYREVTIESKLQKKVITFVIDPQVHASSVFINCELQASFITDHKRKTSYNLWHVLAFIDGEVAWKMHGNGDEVYDFDYFCNKTGKNLFGKTEYENNALKIKLAFLGLKEVMIKNLEKTHHKKNYGK